RSGGRRNDRRRRYVRTSGVDHARLVVGSCRNDGGQRFGPAVGYGAQPSDGMGVDAACRHHAFGDPLRPLYQRVLRTGPRFGGYGTSAARSQRADIVEDTMKAMDVMVRDVVTVKPDTDVATAIKLLVEHDVSALPVVDQTGTVIGVISEADLVRRAENGTEKQRPWWLEALVPGSILAEEFSKS